MQIAEVKDFLDSNAKFERPHAPTNVNQFVPELLCSDSYLPIRAEILCSIPPRPVVDRLVSRYFISVDGLSGR